VLHNPHIWGLCNTQKYFSGTPAMIDIKREIFLGLRLGRFSASAASASWPGGAARRTWAARRSSSFPAHFRHVGKLAAANAAH